MAYKKMNIIIMKTKLCCSSI